MSLSSCWYKFITVAENILNSGTFPCNHILGKIKLINLTFCTASVREQNFKALSKYRFKREVRANSFKVLSFRMPCQLVIFLRSFKPLANWRWKNGDLLSDSFGVIGINTSCSRDVFNLCNIALKRLCRDLLEGSSDGNLRMYLPTVPTSRSVWELESGSQHLHYR